MDYFSYVVGNNEAEKSILLHGLHELENFTSLRKISIHLQMTDPQWAFTGNQKNSK